MWHVLKKIFRKIEGQRYKRNMERALALHLRGEARADGLTPASVRTHLEIEWRARDVHPWDRRLLSPAERAAALVTQSLADTEAAIYRLFENLPHVDLITLKVFDKVSDNLLVSGTVSRGDVLARNGRLSIGMRLRYLGLTYQSAGSLLGAPEEDVAAARW